MSVAARGDLSVRAPVTGRDEIGDMAASFNRMSSRLLEVYAGLHEEQGKLTTIILGANEGIVVTGVSGRVVLVNPAATELLGKSEHQIVDAGLSRLVDDPAWMASRLAGEGRDGEAEVIAYRQRLLQIHVSTLRSESGGEIGSAAIIRDVTEEERLEAELRRLAHTDALTGLGNRHRFDAVLGSELRRAQRYRNDLSLVLVDVDRFKAFNDQHGHDCGDRVLRACAAAIERQVDGQGACCRFGGEELAVILPDYPATAAAQLAEELRKSIEELRVDGLQVTASFGVAAVRPGLEHTAELIGLADAALYRAKRNGRNRVELAADESK
jgi:diguanylate cyclase (GGDEF)-like protein/PAS domain S-box-containing protein